MQYLYQNADGSRDVITELQYNIACMTSKRICHVLNTPTVKCIAFGNNASAVPPREYKRGGNLNPFNQIGEKNAHAVRRSDMVVSQ